MKWQDEGKFSLKTTIGQLVPSFAKSNKAPLLYEDVLTHQARLKAWIPFWMDYVDSTDMIFHSQKFKQKFTKDDVKYNYLERFFSPASGEARLKKNITDQKAMWKEYVDITKEVTRWKPFTLSYAQSEEYPTQVAPTLS